MKPKLLSSAAAVAQRAGARPAAEVGHHHAPVRDLRRDLGQDRRDVLVRQSVEPVPLHAGTAQLTREGHQLRHGGLAAVEARVEARHLRHARQPLGRGLDRGDVVGLVQRRERDECAKLLQHAGGDDGGAREARPAVHDPVADAQDARALEAAT